jgi:chemotaxis protein methyltransferase CheR
MSSFTGFFRLPTQFEALSGPVVDFFQDEGTQKKLKIIVVGCSNGAEPYSIASVLNHCRPDLSFHVKAYDINPESVRKAQSARYQPSEVYNNKSITPDFIQATFDIDDETYIVKDAVRKNVEFGLVDALDTNLQDKTGKADILFVQNLLFHLERSKAIQAFRNVFRVLEPQAALFIDGLDLDLREKYTQKQCLKPLDFKIEEIHNEARRARGVGWPYHYWGLEPFMSNPKNWRRRYSTIFLKK